MGDLMHGLMQDIPLTVGMLLPRMETTHAAKSVITRQRTGAAYGTTFDDVAHRARLVAAALDALAVPASARVATFGWNSQRHLELFVGVPAAGRILHTVNHRLHGDELRYILDHAADDIVVVDQSLLPAVWDAVSTAPTVRHVVVMPDEPASALPDDSRLIDYEELLAAQSPHGLDTVLDERAAATLCYTSGTTGRPKGVLYDHRSIVLHAMMLLAADSFGVCEPDVVMPIVPMFHVNAWGLPYAALMAGADLSLPGPAMEPASLADQLVHDRVTLAGAVPSVWRAILPHAEGRDLSKIRKAICGGGAMPKDLRAAYQRAGVTLHGAWGMTETSPLVTHARIPARRTPDDAGASELLGLPGPSVALVDVRIWDEDSAQVLPNDGASTGELQVRGPTIAAAYYRSDATALTADGWLHTGDVATIDPDGIVRIVDRTKDLVKSGGEWISSIALEDAIMAHPGVVEAAVTAEPDERWEERPHAWVVRRNPTAPSREELLEFLRGRIAKWWLPDHVTFIDDLPRTGTGKVSKVALRALSREP